jgi:hypothetical protein
MMSLNTDWSIIVLSLRKLPYLAAGLGVSTVPCLVVGNFVSQMWAAAAMERFIDFTLHY